MTTKLFAAAAVAASLAACATVPQRSATGRFAPGARDEVFSRALRVAASRGFVLASVNREEGIVATQPSRVGDRPCAVNLVLGVVSLDARDSLQVLVQRDGAATVALRRECAEPHGRWSATHGERVTAAIEEEQQAILAEVLGEAPPGQGPSAVRVPDTETPGRLR